MTNTKTGYIVQNLDGTFTWFPKRPKLDKERHWYIEQTTEEFMKQPTPHRLSINDIKKNEKIITII